MAAPHDLTKTGIISLDPLITYTKRHLPTPIGVAGACPELFRGRKSLHFVSPVWAYYDHDILDIARHWRRAMADLPDAMIVVLASTEEEAFDLSAAGVFNALCNVSIFVDERVFRPLAPFDYSQAAYDAIYNARLEAYKRHELASAVDNLALLYDPPFSGIPDEHEAEIRRRLPNARFLNDEYSKGRYVALGPEECVRELNRARCGLCLSAAEGVMRASIEYLLCGLPVVSTASIGGRDRYYDEPFAMVVEANPHAVAQAVIDMGKRKLDKRLIRERVGRVVEFERRNVLKLVNALCQKHFGVGQLFSTLDPFIKAWPFVDPKADWSRTRLLGVAQALGASLEPPAVEAV